MTAIPAEAPHNINDHGSTSGGGLITTIANTISQVGANTIYATAPFFLVLGPEHAATLARDGYGAEDVQAAVFERSAMHVSRVSPENRESYTSMDRPLVDDHHPLTDGPEDIHVLVAGGPGKHSAYIPPFGFTEACSVRVANPPLASN